MKGAAPIQPWRPERSAIDRHVPDAVSADVESFDAALAATTHLCIAAHPDDVEWIGLHGVLACFDRDGTSFTGCVVTDGAGSVRGGPYADVDDATLARLRRGEQRRAAALGRYGALVQLGHSSAHARAASEDGPTAELVGLIAAARPHSVYLHAPTDRHGTHVAVAARALDALRRVDAADGWRPERVLGVEGWAALDWLAPEDRVELDVSDRPHLFAALVGAHDSQLCGGKPYDRAMAARFVANATFAQARARDGATRLALAVDLAPAARADGSGLGALVEGLLARGADAVRERLRGLS